MGHDGLRGRSLHSVAGLVAAARMRNHIVLALTLCQLANLGELSSQTSNVPEDPRSLVVAVQGYFLVGGAPEQGAGIILGTRADTLYIVTAGHVVQRTSV